jgi:hypothetical protein
VAGLRARPRALRLRLLRGDVPAGRGPGRARPGLRRRVDRRGDQGAARLADRAGPPERVARPAARAPPGAAARDASRRAARRRVRAARQDRSRGVEHEDARSAAVPDPPRPPPPDRRRLVHLPDVRLRASAVRRPRGHHPLDLHARVREQPRALRLGDREDGRDAAGRTLGRPAASADPAAAIRVRAPGPRVHDDEQAQAAQAGPGRRGHRLGRSAHADPGRDAAPRLHARGHPQLLRPGRRGQEQLDGRRRQARVRGARRPERSSAAAPRRPAAAAPDPDQRRRRVARDRAALPRGARS